MTTTSYGGLSYRPYRPSIGIELALEEIEQKKGLIYDPDAADACLNLFRKQGLSLDELCRAFKGDGEA